MNQTADHRKQIIVFRMSRARETLQKDFLFIMADSTAHSSPQVISRAEHLQRLRSLCPSDLERDWLDYMEKHHYSLPSQAQKLVEACHTRPDFLYEKDCAAIYVDGYHHLFEERHQRDLDQAACMEDIGYTMIRFGLLDDWDLVIANHRHLPAAEKDCPGGL